MFTGAFSSYSINDTAAVKQFYGETLGLEVADAMGGVRLGLPGGYWVFMYAKDDHQPANYTVLNLETSDIEVAVDALAGHGVAMLRYDSLPAQQDERGILRGSESGIGPDIAWFADPAGNILSVMQTEES